MRYWLLGALLLLSSNSPCFAENFLKDMAKNMITGGGQQQQQQGVGGNAVGQASLPPGQYMMTNLSTGQGFYVFITGQGQIVAQDPRLLQVTVQPLQAGGGGFIQPAPGGLMPQQQGYGQPQQPQQGGGLGSMMRGALNNYMQGQGQPQQ